MEALANRRGEPASDQAATHGAIQPPKPHDMLSEALPAA
ncbi:MAG: hypothetical protein OJF49_001866 [Ktedonobacterales bacterium]|nr:MAG: hypothetical protein OJF49_001866 [Ktedonobacterales bacterium]